MKRKLFFGVFLLAMLFPGLFSLSSDAKADTCEENFSGESGASESHLICEDETWSSGTEHVFDRPVIVVGEAKLTVEPGVRAYFKRGRTMPGLSVRDGTIDAVGTESEPIVFTKKETDDSFGVEFSNMNGSESLFRYVHIVDGGVASSDMDNGEQQGFFRRFFAPTAYAARHIPGLPTLSFNYGKLAIEHSVFSGSRSADIHTENSGVNGLEYEGNRWSDDSYLHVSDTNFDGEVNIPAFTADRFSCPDWDSSCESKVLLANDWYGSANGPTMPDNPMGSGKAIIGKVKLDGWSAARFPDFSASNVLFLPGIKASRLYKDGAFGTEDRLWIPNYFGNDLRDLALDEDGRSKESVYTRDIVDEIGLPDIGQNLYASFIGDLKNLKEKGTINDYESFAYDWRQNVTDIAEHGTPYEHDSAHSAVADLEALAASSKSGKTTIVAHSNGGLLAKAIMLELGKAGKTDIVDKIVFVGTPQMGAPLAILSLLYGYDEASPLGALISRQDARTLAETMPGAYGLLPSKIFFDRMENPFVTFTSERTRFKRFRDAYGEGIGDAREFFRFLSGEDDGRSEPDNGDVESENTLRRNLLAQAEAMHDRLDAWVPPANIQVIEIGGWGLDTVSGVEYTEKETARCYSGGSMGPSVPSCAGTDEYEPIYEPKFTVDGDKVVTTPSALMLPESDNVKRYWVDLWSYNKGLTIDREHKNLFEVASLRTFFSNIIMSTYSSGTLPKNILSSRPHPDGLDSETRRLRMSLYSPLDIHLYDVAGNHTGPKTIMVDGHEQTFFEEGIPNSYYYRFGDRKYVGFGEGSDVHVEMDGYAEGSYTLTLTEVNPTVTGERILEHTTFENLPTTADTTVTFTIPRVGLSSMSALSADLDGDGSSDYTLTPVSDGTVTLSRSGEEIVTAPGATKKQHAKNGRNSVDPAIAMAGSGAILSGALYPYPETEISFKKDVSVVDGRPGAVVAGDSDSGDVSLPMWLLSGIVSVSVILGGLWFGRRFVSSKS